MAANALLRGALWNPQSQPPATLTEVLSSKVAVLPRPRPDCRTLFVPLRGSGEVCQVLTGGVCERNKGRRFLSGSGWCRAS